MIYDFFKDSNRRLHRDQGGAVALLMLATALILFMMALVLFDSGFAARDKMDVQIAADSSAMSHSVVKSRGMNMISYANVIKRMYFSYAVTYINGLTALVAVTAAHTALCLRTCWGIPCPRLKSCYELLQNFLIIISEVVESIFDTTSLSTIPFVDGNVKNELERLERYQQYMAQITPWWAWSENVIRSMNNGAMVSSSFPTPGSLITDVKTWVVNAAGISDWLLDTTFLTNLVPSVSNALDALPLERRDRMEVWSTAAGPFDFAVKTPAIASAADYCLEWTGSMEMIVNTTQTAVSEAKGFEWWLPAFLFLQVAGGSVGCVAVGAAWYFKAQNAHFDWMINVPDLEGEPEKWTQATSNLTMTYKPRKGRHAEDGDRQKYGFLPADYSRGGIVDRKNSGYWAIAKSEIVYKAAQGTGFGLFDTIGDIPVLGDRLGLGHDPDMWSPKWTAKLRPVSLPNENWGSATMQGEAGLNTAINDMLPYMVLAGIVGGVFDNNFSVGTAWDDLQYIFLSNRFTFGNDASQGISK